MKVYIIKRQIQEAESKILSENEVVENFNNSIGKTMGFAKDLHQVKIKMSNDTAFLRFIALKVAAHIALQKAADEHSKSEQLKVE